MGIETITFQFHKILDLQALTNQLLSNVRSHTPVSKCLFVNVLSNQKRVHIDEAENFLHAFL